MLNILFYPTLPKNPRLVVYYQENKKVKACIVYPFYFDFSGLWRSSSLYKKLYIAKIT